MKSIINRLTNHEILTDSEAKSTLIDISKGLYNPCQIASFLTIFMIRGIKVKELEGFRDALLELCIGIDFDGYDLIDFCGTGGDGKDTFNISTLSSFVAAGAGLHVAKHSNYGISSGCGSSNVLETLGIKLTNNSDFLKKAMDTAGIVILHAPFFHPAMKNVAPIRKDLGVKTFFNILGPLSNPTFTKYQVTGVFDLELARIYGYLFENTQKHYNIVYALDGYDEISLTGYAKIISNKSEYLLHPQDLGLSPVNPEMIRGGESVEKSAEIFMNIIRGKGTDEQNRVVCTNSGLGIATAKNISLQKGYDEAREVIMSGKAFKVFKKLQNLCKTL